jgi:putative nucleotidyltransferase with HDIG domain
MKFVLPELLDGYGEEQNIYHKFDVYYHNMKTLDAAARLTPDLITRLAALLHDVGKPRTKRGDGQTSTFYNHEMVGGGMARAILRRLRFPNAVVARAVRLIQNHMFHFTDDWTDAAVRRFIRKTDDIMDDLFVLREADRLGSGKKIGNSRILDRLREKIRWEREAQSAFKITDLAVNGTDVMTVLKIRPSKTVGETLEKLMQIVLDDPSQNTRENLLELIKKYGSAPDDKEKPAGDKAETADGDKK